MRFLNNELLNYDYAKPSIIRLKLKVSTLCISQVVVKVNVAATIAPGSSVAPSWFQLRVIRDSAVVGIQSEVYMLRVSVVLPVFFT